MKVRNYLCIMILFISTGCSQQGEKWELAKRYNTIKGYERFMSQYPEGTYADSALKIIYNIVRTKNTIEVYEGFISKHPKNVYSDSARKEIINIRYQIAHSENTIPAYEKFLTSVPEGPMADLAKSNIKTILDDRHPAFRNVKTIQWSPKALSSDGKYVLPKVFSITNRLFKTSGIILVKGDTMKCDAQLILSAKGTALGGYYTGSLSGYHYTGASVSIRLKLRASGKQIVNKSFNGRRSKSYFISNSYKKRSNAPWSGAIKKSDYDVGLIKILSNVLGRTGIINALLKKRGISTKDAKLLKKTLEKKYGLSIKDVAMIALDNYNWKIRQNGVNLLKSLKDSTTVNPLLTVLLKDKHKSVRYSASRALTNYADQCPLEVLLEALNDSYNSVRSQTVYLLGKKKDSRVFELLLTLLLDKNKRVKNAAGNAMNNYAKHTTLEVLLGALNHSHYKVRSKIAYVLGKRKDFLAFEPLIALLSDKNRSVRVEAGKALNNYAKHCSLEILLEKLNDSKYQIRSKMAYLLGRKKDYRAIEPLIALLSDKNRSVRTSSERALRTIAGKKFKKTSSYTRYSNKLKSNYWREWLKKNKK